MLRCQARLSIWAFFLREKTNKQNKKRRANQKIIAIFLFSFLSFFFFFIFTYLCSSLSICLAREILFLMEDIKDTSTGKESSSFPATRNLKKNKIKKTNMNKKMKETNEWHENGGNEGNDHLKKLLIVKQILLVSSIENSWKMVWRKCKLIFKGVKG